MKTERLKLKRYLVLENITLKPGDFVDGTTLAETDYVIFVGNGWWVVDKEYFF
jgi:hypothetical protein